MTGRVRFTAGLLVVLAACKAETPNDASAAQATGAKASAETTAARGGGAPGGNGAAPGRGRAAATITLAASDVSTVTPTTIEDLTPVSGDLRPIETVSVRSRIEGDLDAVLVREGDVVHAGQVLARFDASEQQSTQRSAEADRAAAESDLANAQWNAEQSAQLFKAGAIADRDNKAAQQALVSAQARLAAADAKLKSTGIALRDTRVISPTSGVVDKRVAEAGEHIPRGTELFSVVRNDVLELVAAMPARDASDVRVGQTVRFVADGRTITGRVARISPTVDPVTRAVTVYVQIPNPGSTLRGGTFATGQVISHTITNVLAIPRDAIHQVQGGQRQFVYRIDGKTIDVSDVKTGVVDERLGLVEVTEGLRAGDRIVSGNVGSLGRGMQVSIAGGDDSGRPSSGRRGGRGGRGVSRGSPPAPSK